MYECSTCKKTFPHTGTLTINSSMKSPVIQDYVILADTFHQTTLEAPCCPFCLSREYIQIEDKSKGKVISLISVPHAEVDKKFAEGYELLDEKDKVWAKESILVKREK